MFLFIPICYAHLFSLFPSNARNPLTFQNDKGMVLSPTKGRITFTFLNPSMYKIMDNGIMLCPSTKKIVMCKGNTNDAWKILRSKTCLRISTTLVLNGVMKEYCWTFKKGGSAVFLSVCSGSPDQIFKLREFDYSVTPMAHKKGRKSIEASVDGTQCSGPDDRCDGFEHRCLDDAGIFNNYNSGTDFLSSPFFNQFKGVSGGSYDDLLSNSISVQPMGDGNMLILRKITIRRRTTNGEEPPTVLFIPYGLSTISLDIMYREITTSILLLRIQCSTMCLRVEVGLCSTMHLQEKEKRQSQEREQ